MTPPLLLVEDLRVALPAPRSAAAPSRGASGGNAREVVRGVSFRIPERGFHALAGESGCGKSVTAMAIARLPPADAPERVSGTVLFRGENLLALSPRRLRSFRREGGLACVFQDPMDALHPALTVATQLREAVPESVPRAGRDAFVRSILADVGLGESADAVMRSHPCELSGGMAQRVCIAMALAQKPALLVADEPTTALDVLVQRKVLRTLKDAASTRGAAVLLITHNLAIVGEYAETMSVLYAGRVVEDGPVREVLRTPAHPYVEALLRALPRLDSTRGVEDLAVIPGRVPPPENWGADGCTFAPRCPQAADVCRAGREPGLMPFGGADPVPGAPCRTAGRGPEAAPGTAPVRRVACFRSRVAER